MFYLPGTSAQTPSPPRRPLTRPCLPASEVPRSQALRPRRRRGPATNTHPAYFSRPESVDLYGEKQKVRSRPYKPNTHEPRSAHLCRGGNEKKTETEAKSKPSQPAYPAPSRPSQTQRQSRRPRTRRRRRRPSRRATSPSPSPSPAQSPPTTRWGLAAARDPAASSGKSRRSDG